MLDPKTKIILSTAALVAGGFAGATSAQQAGQDPVGSALLSAYIFWSLFWGVPPFWGWWRSSGRRLFRFVPRGAVGWAIRTSLSLALLFVGGYCFSVFGGGVVCFAKAVSAASSRA